MVGYTFANLEDELLFVEQNLAWLPADSLLQQDVPMVFAPASSSKEVEQRDPALSVLRPSEWRHRVEEFLTGPIRRYADGVLEVTMNKSLDSRATTVPGSYTINHSATVRFADRPATSSWATPSATKSQDSPRACQHSVETSFPTGPTPRTPTCSAYSSEPSQPPSEDGAQSWMSSHWDAHGWAGSPVAARRALSEWS